MKVSVSLVIFILFLIKILQAQPTFNNAFDLFLEKPEYKHAIVGIHVEDAISGEIIYGLNSEKMFIPASVLKLVTSAVALEILGPEYRFRTRVGYTGKIENGVLKGNLVIIGGGDPTLGSEHFQEHNFQPHFLESLAQRIKNAGISRIEGNLVLDGSLYGAERIPPRWNWEDIGNYYGAGTSALTVYDNLLRINFRSPPRAGMPTEIISVYPNVEGLEWKNEVFSSEVNRDLAYVFGSPLDGSRVIRGTIPKNKSIFTIKASNPYPELLLANELIFYLAKSGVFITGKSVNKKADLISFMEIEVLESPPLAEIIKVLNYKSVNLFAEHIVKQISSEQTGTGDRIAGLNIISGFLQSKGFNTDQLNMVDGSGLSHFNSVSPLFLTSLLRFMNVNNPNSNIFYESLPPVGQGTLQQFSTGNFPGQTLKLKSGNINRVCCYAGYYFPASGKKYIFTFMINHYAGSQRNIIVELEKLLLALQ